jgi:putative peptidoglycan binding protein
MLKFITLLIGCSLTLAVNVQAAEQPDAAAKKDAAKKPKNVQKQQVAPKQQQLKAPKTHVQKEHVNKPVTNTAKTTVAPKKQELRRMAPVKPNTPANVQSNKIQKNKPQLETRAQQQQQVQANNQQLQKNKLSKQTVEKIRAQHRNFRAQPKSSIASVQFNKNYQINGAQNWSGSNYQVFRSYRPQWHDQGWWRSHHHHLSLIGGGWYFWDGGYWYPAWGYDNSAAYYPYDGPIYSGPSVRPFDQVVADVQAALQEQGYYKGEVDGLLGPLTREALAEYQQANGLYATQTIDQPTLNSLGLG